MFPMNIPDELSDKHQHRTSSMISMQEPAEENVNRISTRSSHKDLDKILQRPFTALHEDLHKIFSWGPAQDHARTSQKDLSNRSSRRTPSKKLRMPGTRWSALTKPRP